jgi:hypothetical protein
LNKLLSVALSAALSGWIDHSRNPLASRFDGLCVQ